MEKSEGGTNRYEYMVWCLLSIDFCHKNSRTGEKNEVKNVIFHGINMDIRNEIFECQSLIPT